MPLHTQVAGLTALILFFIVIKIFHLQLHLGLRWLHPSSPRNAYDIYIPVVSHDEQLPEAIAPTGALSVY